MSEQRGTPAWWIAREYTNALKGGYTWDDLMPDVQRTHVAAAQALLDSGVVLAAGPPDWHRMGRWVRLRHRLRWSLPARLLRRAVEVGRG